MFSATFSNDIRKLAKGLVHNPVEISVAPRNTAAERIEQIMYAAEKSQKPQMLMQILRDLNLPQVMVFSRTKHGANRLVKKLDKEGFLAAAIHGNKSQGARTKALDDFKAGKVQVLVATDIAARGIDIEKMPYGGCGAFLGLFYATKPKFNRYSSGLRPPSDTLMRFSLYQRRYESSSSINWLSVTVCQS